MIKRISKLNQFGIFRDFAWDTNRLDDFGRYNILYGWNYSGKTTLSRVFGTLQAPDKILAYPGGTFEVQLDDGMTRDMSHLGGAPKVRVFNRDFVAANFEKEHKAPAIYIVGEDNIQAKHRLDTLTQEGLLGVSDAKGRQIMKAQAVLRRGER